jgi:DNA-binding MarR family transcriptional regulator
MLEAANLDGPDLRESLGAEGRLRAVPPLVAAKLWDNPCWLSARLNMLALAFNTPVYGVIEAEAKLSRPEFVVLYSLFIKDGVAAKDVALSSFFPKNTISRAVHGLVARKLIRRDEDAEDRRSFALWLTARGRATVERFLPAMVERERAMLSRLTRAERLMLSDLLAKIIVEADAWRPSHTEEDEA